MTTPAERVAAGAAELDRRFPGWAAEINASILDMASPDLDVLGQLDRRPGIDLDDLIENPDRCVALGIDAEIIVDGGDIRLVPSYAELTDLWQAERRRRLDGAA